MNTIWILDDEPGMRWVLEKALDKAGWPVRSFADGAALKAALDALEGAADPRAPAVLVSDIRMPGPDGLTVLATVRTRLPGLPVIMMTAYTDLDTTVAAFEQGAFDYLAKPFDIQAAVELIGRAAQSAPSRSDADMQFGRRPPVEQQRLHRRGLAVFGDRLLRHPQRLVDHPPRHRGA